MDTETGLPSLSEFLKMADEGGSVKMRKRVQLIPDEEKYTNSDRTHKKTDVPIGRRPPKRLCKLSWKTALKRTNTYDEHDLRNGYKNCSDCRWTASKILHHRSTLNSTLKNYSLKEARSLGILEPLHTTHHDPFKV